MQYPWVTIDPEEEDGIELAARLDSWVQAVQSMHSGATDPTYLVSNMMWVKEISSVLREVWTSPNGVDKIKLWTFNPTTLVNNLAHSDDIMLWTKAQRQAPQALVSAASITVDASVHNYFFLTLGHNATLANPTNLVAGQSGMIVINHDGTKTLAFGAFWKFESGDIPSLSPIAAKDVLAWYADTTTSIIASLMLDVK